MADHDMSLLGPYVLGVLDQEDVRVVEEHLPGCADCQQELSELEKTEEFLGELPPEAFLEGPPVDADLLLQRTLRASRNLADPPAPSSADPRRPRWRLAAASAAVAGAFALGGGGGVLVGRETADKTPNPTQTIVAGSRYATATDASTGARMKTTVEPRAGWSWVNVRVSGLKKGADCELVVTDAEGKTFIAGSWVVSDTAAREGSPFSGGVNVPIGDVASVEVRTAQGEHVVTTAL